MRKIGIHLDDEIGVAFQCPREALYVSGAQPQFALAMHHVESARVALRQVIGNLARAVWRCIVYNKNLQPLDAELQKFGSDCWQIVGFVIGGDNHYSFHRVSTAGLIELEVIYADWRGMARSYQENKIRANALRSTELDAPKRRPLPTPATCVLTF